MNEMHNFIHLEVTLENGMRISLYSILGENVLYHTISTGTILSVSFPFSLSWFQIYVKFLLLQVSIPTQIILLVLSEAAAVKTYGKSTSMHLN